VTDNPSMLHLADRQPWRDPYGDAESQYGVPIRGQAFEFSSSRLRDDARAREVVRLVLSIILKRFFVVDEGRCPMEQ
jgi:hypothetical protein